MKKKPVQICIFLILSLLFTSCGQAETAPEQENTTPVETPEPEPAPPETEEELRQAIGQLGQGEEALKREYYEQLFYMDVFQEADYEALAQLYAHMGETALQRDILSKELRLYPSRETALQVSAIVVEENGENQEMAELARQIMEALDLHDTAALRELTARDDWRRILQDGMLGVETKTRYRQGEDLLQIAADGAWAEITWLGAEGRFCFYRGDEHGAVLGETVLTESAYSGAVTVIHSDGEGNVTRSYTGTLREGVCVEQISIEYQGVTYTGKLNDDGTTAEEQYAKVAEAGGVVYAYTGDGKSYLYQENADPGVFRLDAVSLGLPEYTEWR